MPFFHLQRPRIKYPILISTLLVLLSGCASGPKPFHIKNIAKTNIDMVADNHLDNINALLQNFLVKLYKRNPVELKKKPGLTIDDRLDQIFNRPGPLLFDELDRRHDIQAMLLTFDPDFTGDRVFALMAGLTGMIRQSYNFHNEFFVLDSLDQQKLYNSARNIEILAWRLRAVLTVEGKPYLLTNGLGGNGEAVNLSFERLIGKMIANQDMMARITADRTNRTINTVVHSVASAAFIPIGL